MVKIMIDLHLHSYFSDGTDSPVDICKKASTAGLKAVALTDHDTIDGISEFLSDNNCLTKIPGVEISIDYSPGTFHLLGLNIDPRNESLRSSMEKLKRYRRNRNNQILTKLSDAAGYNITPSDITSENAGEIGRVHIANFLLRKGIVKNMDEAFGEYLGRGKPLYADKKRLNINTAVAVIKDAGGLSVIAHPYSLNLDKTEFINFASEMKAKGIDGVEAYCPLHSESDMDFYRKVAKENNLIVTGGSDYHGNNKSGVIIGETGMPEDEAEYILKNITGKSVNE